MIRYLYAILVFAVISNGCVKINPNSSNTLLPTLTTTLVTDVMQNTAITGGNVLTDGGFNIRERGVCYSLSHNPVVAGSHTSDGKGTGPFESVLANLTPATLYYVRAYATNDSGRTGYGNEVSFTTTTFAGVPVVVTDSAVSITNNSIVTGGNVTSGGDAAVTARGICWGTSSNPTLFNNHSTDGSGAGIFTTNLSGLNPGTKYYIRAYATNNIGTGYGNLDSFKTTSVGLPVVVSGAINNVTNNSFNSGGNVTSDGGFAVTARGVCWGSSSNPDITGSHTTDGTGLGVFTSSITGLNASTYYYARAYATNINGTTYGFQYSLTTLALTQGTGCSFGSTLTLLHTAGAVAPVSKNVTYNVVQSSSSGALKCWIAQNLGADNTATSIGDSTEHSAGWYWQFNKPQGYKHDGTNRTPNTSWITNISDGTDWLPTNDPCALLLGTGWRIPTNTEYSNVIQFNGGWTSYGAAYSSVLKIHSAGYLGVLDGSLNGRGAVGSYWSSTQLTGTQAYYLDVEPGSNGNTYPISKSYGYSLRCIKD